MKPDLLDTKQAAKYLGLSRVSLAKWRCYRSPDKPAYIKCGRAIRYRLEDLDSWIEDNRVQVRS